MNTTSIVIKQIIGGPSDFGMGWIVILASSIIAILAAFVSVLKWLYGRIQSKTRLLKKVSSLTIGTNIEYFKTLLGNPVFINKIANYNELIFVNPYFYTQAFVDLEGEVVLFSVTTRRKNFNPKLNIGGVCFPIGIGKYKHWFCKERVVKLGKTTFSKLGEPKKVFKRGGDHGGFDFYSEVHYFGNPGHYLDYAFSINENVRGAFSHGVPRSFMENVPEDSDELERFRIENTINTYTVIGSIQDEEITRNDIEFGPRRSQIRVLNE